MCSLYPSAGSSQDGSINSADARTTLQLVLAKAEARGLQPQHLAWPSVAAAVSLLAATDPMRLEARARCGFSHRCSPARVHSVCHYPLAAAVLSQSKTRA